MQSSWRLVRFDEVGSTQDVARSLADEGAGEGTLVVADRQSAGRGRRGRPWISPSGNLHASLILQPRIPVAEAGQIAFVAGLAIADAIASECARDGLDLSAALRLKWPNDILIGGAKVAGLLLEAAPNPSGRVERMIVGVGVNVVAAPSDTPYPATSLRLAGAVTANAASLGERFLDAMRAGLDRWKRLGFAPVRADWTARAEGLGGMIAVRESGGETRGIFRGLDSDGALVLAVEGELAARRILTGDLFFPGM